MADFGHLKALEVKAESTVEYRLWQIKGTPLLTLAPATESNIPLFNAALKRSGKGAKNVRVNAQADLGTIKEGRLHDCELYSKFVVKGWSGVVDSSGDEPPFTVENVHDFLTALPDYIFDDVREYARNPANFVDEMPDTGAVSGN
jgi:hypothetical protein